MHGFQWLGYEFQHVSFDQSICAVYRIDFPPPPKFSLPLAVRQVPWYLCHFVLIKRFNAISLNSPVLNKQTNKQTNKETRTHTQTNKHTRTHTYTRTRTHTHAHTHTYTHTHTHTHTRTHTHAHTHAHTHITLFRMHILPQFYFCLHLSFLHSVYLVSYYL
jgi:hypothetical protein